MESNSKRRVGTGRFAIVGVLASVIVAATTLPHQAVAQFADPDQWGTDGEVLSIARSGNLLYAGGAFTYAGPPNGSCVALSLVGGTPLANWPRFDGRVRAIVGDGRGGWFVGGLFSRVNGVARANLVRIRPDGAIDPSMPEVHGEVRALARMGTTLYLGGGFLSIGGVPRSRLSAIDSETGAVTPWNPGASGPVSALLASGGRLYVGGEFTTLAAQSRSHAGAFAFDTGTLESWAPAVNQAVDAMAAGDGVLYLGGRFSAVNGVPRAAAACVDTASGALTAWDPALLDGTSVGVLALLFDGARVFVGGRFTHSHSQQRNSLAAVDAVTGATLPWNASLAHRYDLTTVAAIERSGEVLFIGGSFSAAGSGRRTNLAAVGAETGQLLNWQGGAEGSLDAISLRGDTVLVGGWTRSCGGVSRMNIAAFDRTSGAASEWQPSPIGPVYEGDVRAVLPVGAVVYAGGRFSEANEQPRYGAAAFGAANGELLPWNPVVSGVVQTMVEHDGLIYLGGYFDSVNGVLRNHLAAVGSTSGQLAGWDLSASYTVFALAVDADTLFAGGMFWHVGGQERHGVAAIDLTRGAATEWNPGIDGVVSALAIDDGRVYAGGYFSNVGPNGAGGIAAISRVTALRDPWPPLMGDRTVTGLSLDQGTLYASGDFSTSPDLGQRTDLAAFVPESGALTSWSFPCDGPLQTVAAYDGLVYVSGVRWTPDMVICGGLGRVRPRDTLAPSVVAHSAANAALGDTVPVAWSATDDFRVESVDAELSRDGVDGPWEALCLGAPNTGFLQWTASGPPSDSCWLRVRARDYQGNVTVSEAVGPFELVAPVADAPAPIPPVTLVLGRPAPSPARASFRIAFDLPRSAPVRLSLLDVQGREVARLRDGAFEPGRHEADVDTRRFAPGLYFVRLRSGGSDRVQRLVVLGR